jgi:hypothetical protein
MTIWFDDEHSEFLWGQLVATWTKGEPVPELSHFSAEQLKAPVVLADLVRQLDLLQIKASNLSKYTDLEVVREKPGVLLVRLPEKQELIDAEASLETGGNYRLPHFYEKFIGLLQAETLEQRLEFQKCRIGDYAIAGCM